MAILHGAAPRDLLVAEGTGGVRGLARFLTAPGGTVVAVMASNDGVGPALDRVTRRLPGGGEQRSGQVEMAAAVARAFETERHLVVQAGTGTGKSLGYLVPAALCGRRVVVATATKALQDQLAQRDLPLVHRALGGGFAWTVLKGRANYLCRQRVLELSSQGFQAELEAQHEGADPGRSSEQLGALLGWAAESTTGDRAGLPFEPSEPVWRTVSVGPRECPGAFRCPAGLHCCAEAARDAAAAAEIVVVNTHLYGAHLASGGSVLPPHDVVVFDEAHQLEDIMTASLGVELTPGRLRGLGSAVAPLLRAGRTGDAELLTEVADRLAALLAERLGARVEDDRELAGALELASQRVRGVLDRLRPELGASPDGEGRRQRAISAATHITEDLHRLIGDGDGDVRWVDGTWRSPVLRASPIDIGILLAPLWSEVTAVMTSATVPARLPERLGVPEGTSFQLDVGSPFDYQRQALLYVARHLPDRRRPESEPALHAELAALVKAAGGRTLALFTSHRALDAASDALRDRLEVRLWRQGELPKGRLLEAFTEEETSCLFATLGFWQGIDVPGPSLSLVVLDRLPFPRPDDPVLQARRDAAGSSAFGLVDLPRTASLLAQGAGRLIRTATDTGVVAVLDPRLATAGYRRALLAGLPPMGRTTDRRQVIEFLGRALLGGGHPCRVAR